MTKRMNIPPAPVSFDTFERQFKERKIAYLRFQLEKIRVSDLSESQKRIQSSFILTHLHKEMQRE